MEGNGRVGRVSIVAYFEVGISNSFPSPVSASYLVQRIHPGQTQG